MISSDRHAHETPVGRREQAKESRRQALIAAAQSSLLEGEFSMRSVAGAAGVSEVTPYNLFGSKAGLLNAVYHDLVRGNEARLPPAAEIDPLSRLFTAIGAFRDDLTGRPAFYRALFAARLESRGGRSHAGHFDEGVEYWQRLIGATIDAQQIEDGMSARLLSRHFIHLLSGVMQEWIDGVIDPDEWHRLVTHGFALLARSLASDGAVGILRPHLAPPATESGVEDLGVSQKGRPPVT